jgi:hypothetical protein
MAKFNVRVAHDLGQQEAMDRLKKFRDQIHARHAGEVKDLQETWNGHVLQYSFKSLGFLIKGTVSVEPNEVTVEGTLPMLAALLKGKIEKTIHGELTKVLLDS